MLQHNFFRRFRIHHAEALTTEKNGDRAVPDYRRYFVPGGTYFFTVVTAARFPLFSDAWGRHFLGQVMRETRDETPFETLAIVLLPDHLHALWTLPSGDD